jgi:hypothetical protein
MGFVGAERRYFGAHFDLGEFSQNPIMTPARTKTLLVSWAIL